MRYQASATHSEAWLVLVVPIMATVCRRGVAILHAAADVSERENVKEKRNNGCFKAEPKNDGTTPVALNETELVASESCASLNNMHMVST